MLKTLICLSALLLAGCSNLSSVINVITPNKSTDKVAVEIETQKPEKVAPKAPEKYIVKTAENTPKVKAYCDKTNDYFKKYKWGKSGCHDYTWHHVRDSYWGNPIVWFTFGDEKKRDDPNMNVTLVMCGVHGDEITPAKFCYDLMDDLRNNPELIGNNLVIVAPLVAPDSFFKRRPTRTNARGVDVNRNFPTKDWANSAKKLWKSRYSSDPRRFPGKYALSEQETIFQVNLINLYRPNKIISVHAPLTLLDYDGPAFTQKKGIVAKQLLEEMSAMAGKYKISDYPFFTGSLGNWAGNEKRIPTFTLELPNSDWHKTDRYYKMFRNALHHAIQHDMVVPEGQSSNGQRKYSGNHQHN
ncbi:MAG: succinylglutamate desuccinylase/aspartoacylase family protein [Bacteriovoracaceae bacterium]|nr:succinylglutamate desuccinylase/aspartoacylase family protein [Bacteriovoracaceae bacterium]